MPFILAIVGSAILLTLTPLQEEARAKEEGKAMKEKVRRPAVAGSFYPGDTRTLSREVRDYLSRASKEEVGGKITALVSPHAGYIFIPALWPPMPSKSWKG